MKKIFCDVCGDEFDYETDELLKAFHQPLTLGNVDVSLADKKLVVKMVGVNNRAIEYDVSVSIKARNENGGHVDTCGACRWAILDKLDKRPREG